MISSFITVRSTSSRLPEKCFLPFGESNVLEHIIIRTRHYGLEPFVCTTDEKSDDSIELLTSKLNVKCFRGSTVNKLKRWRDCCRYFDVKKFHTVDADDPFFDGELVKKSFKKLSEGFDVVEPTKSSSGGAASVGYSLTYEMVNNVCSKIDDDSDTEMMWYYLEKYPNIKKTILNEIDTNIPEKLRLTLDYEEDYWLLESVRRILGNLASRKEINQLFIDNPDMYKINWFRNEEWKEGQESKAI